MHSTESFGCALSRRPPGGSCREATEGECEYLGLRVLHTSGQPDLLIRSSPSVASRQLPLGGRLCSAQPVNTDN